MSVAKLERSIEKICEMLRRQERAQDGLLVLTREIVRGCALAIKAMHARERKLARRELEKVERLVRKARKGSKDFEYVVLTAYQEYAEAKILLAVQEGEELPTYEELDIPFEAYLLGLCDAVGELRREMLEELKRGRRKNAQRYFETMNAIYEAMLPIHFSNSLLPNFKKKQDVARIQVEQARSELLR